MNRYAYAITKTLAIRYSCLLSWSTWSEFCNFVPKPIFKSGLYLDKYGRPAHMSDNDIGVILSDGSKEYILKQGEEIFYCNGYYSFKDTKTDDWIDIHE